MSVPPDIMRKSKVRGRPTWRRSRSTNATGRFVWVCAKKRVGLVRAKIELMRAIRVIVIALGWIVALSMAGTAIALAREYGFDDVGWGWTAFLATPLILMMARMLWTWRRRLVVVFKRILSKR